MTGTGVTVSQKLQTEGQLPALIDFED